MVRVAITGILLILMVAVTSCTALPNLFVAKSAKGTEDMAEQTYAVGGFTAVSIGSAFTADITRGDAWHVQVTADSAILPHVKVEQDGDTLRVELERIVRLNVMNMHVAITMPELTSLTAAGASDVKIGGFAHTAQMTISAAGASKIAGAVHADTLALKASGASKITLQGAADRLTLQASGASLAHLEELSTAAAEITLSGASSADVTASERIDLVAGGGSELRYGGGAQINSKVSGGSSARARQ